MATRICRLELSMIAVHRTVTVVDEAGPWPETGSGRWFEAGAGGAHVRTHTHGAVALILEVWDRRTLRPPVTEWPVEAVGTATFASGVIAVVPTPGVGAPELAIQPGAYGVRACAQGRPDLAPLPSPEPVERYLLQLWPA